MSDSYNETRARRRRQVVRAALAALLLASVALNVVLIYSLIDAFRSVQVARIFPLGFAEDSQRSEPERAAGDGRPVFELIGDSRAYLWQTNSWNKSFRVVNHAHGGQTSRQVLLQLREMPRIAVAVSVVQVGINDLHPLGVMPEDADRVVAALQENLREIVAALLARSDVVVVTTIFPAGEVPLRRQLVWSEATRARIVEVNAALAALAASSDRVIVLDAYSLLRSQDQDQLRAQYADHDFFLHVNAAAYATLNEELAKLLRMRGMLGAG
ncbi:MAG TPA: SGNH/GDSL hydrolase family protein [Steroidobacteraceae bacterium]|nr:SGNH/GDSL hydrolase family protein [Steroidobacteraceae bacterium]